MADTNDESDTGALKPVKEIVVIQDQGFFEHDTGDTYDGFFEAKKKDKSVKMHGAGVYTTAEGDLYSGNWENDRLGLTGESTITYKDGSKYTGALKDWTYSGHASYHYPDDSCLLCDFSENSPTGNMTLIDPNGHTWLGKAELGFAWFAPINHYCSKLDKGRESEASRDRKSGVEKVRPHKNPQKSKSVQ